ncbi:MAG: recombinase family protein [Cyclobacteriaceae bacterium]
MNAVIYSRVSTEDQDNQRQIDELEQYANYQKMKVIKVFQEKISGAVKARERAEFNSLLKFVEKEKVDTILVWELSRLGRSMTDVMDTIEKLSEKGINVYIKKEGFNTLDKGKKSIMTNIIISVISGFAEMERETIRARSKSGIRANVAGGGSGTGVIKAYGFKKVGKKLEVDEDEAEIIRLIFSKYLSGLGTMSIANYLNEKKILTRYNKLFNEKKVNINGIEKEGNKFKWVDGTIWSILNNSIYKGVRKHAGETFKVPVIVNEATFDEVQKRLSNNYNKKGINVKHENPLSNLLVCGICGRSYFLHKRTNGKDNAYKCLSKRYKEYCGNTSINYDKLNNALFGICKPIIFNDLIDRPSAKKAIRERKDNLDSELKTIEKTIDSFSRKADKIYDSYLEELITKTKYKEMKAVIEADILKENEKRSLTLKKLEDVKQLEKRKGSDEYDYNVFKQHISQAIEYIKIYPAKTDEEIYNFKRDVCTLIEVKSKLDWMSNEPIYYRFILSRYSDLLSYPSFSSSKESDVKKDILKEKYSVSDAIKIDKMKMSATLKAPKGFKPFIKKRERVF